MRSRFPEPVVSPNIVTVQLSTATLEDSHPMAQVRTLTAAQVREFDRCAAEEFALPGRVLMENAGRGVAELLIEKRVRGPILFLCGKGNNGGDAYVTARHLDGRGIDCRLLVAAEQSQLTGDAAANCEAALRAEITCRFLGDAPSSNDVATSFQQLAAGVEWIVDGLLGIGVAGSPRPPLDQLIGLANQAEARRLAIDIPSGLNADTGEPGQPTFLAEATCTFAAAKPGLLTEEARRFVGELTIASLGTPRKLNTSFNLSSD